MGVISGLHGLHEVSKNAHKPGLTPFLQENPDKPGGFLSFVVGKPREIFNVR